MRELDRGLIAIVRECPQFDARGALTGLKEFDKTCTEHGANVF